MAELASMVSLFTTDPTNRALAHELLDPIIAELLFTCLMTILWSPVMYVAIIHNNGANSLIHYHPHQSSCRAY